MRRPATRSAAGYASSWRSRRASAHRRSWSSGPDGPGRRVAGAGRPEAGPRGVVVERAGWAGPARGGGGETGGVPAGDCPADEARRPDEVAAGPGQPLVELGLGAGGQGQPACGEPVQERRGGGDGVAHVLDLLAGGGPAVEAAAQPADRKSG